MSKKKFGKKLNKISADIMAAPDMSDSCSDLEINQGNDNKEF